MTKTNEIEQTKQEIKVLQAKLELLEEIGRHNANTKMSLENEGEFSLVSYGGVLYYRIQYPTEVVWYRKSRIDWTLGHIDDIKTKNELESVWLINDVKYQNDDEAECLDEPENNEWRDVALKFGRKLPVMLPYGYDKLSPNAWFSWVVFTYDNYMNQRDRESGYCPSPQSSEEVEDGLRAAMRQAKKDGVFDVGIDRDITENVENKYNNIAGMINCRIEGNPPNGYSYWNEWFKECGSKGILHNLKLSSLDDNQTLMKKLLNNKIDERGYIDLSDKPKVSEFRQKLFDGIESVFYSPEYERTHWEIKVNMAVNEVLTHFYDILPDKQYHSKTD